MIGQHGEHSLQALQSAVPMQMEEKPKGREGKNWGRASNTELCVDEEDENNGWAGTTGWEFGLLRAW